MEDNVRKRMYVCVCDWVTLLYSRKWTEHCKQTIMEKIKILKKQKTKNWQSTQWSLRYVSCFKSVRMEETQGWPLCQPQTTLQPFSYLQSWESATQLSLVSKTNQHHFLSLTPYQPWAPKFIRIIPPRWKPSLTAWSYRGIWHELTFMWVIIKQQQSITGPVLGSFSVIGTS